MTLAFLSPSRCEPGTTASPLGHALGQIGWSAYLGEPPQIRDLSLEGIVELRGDVAAVPITDGEELVSLSLRRAFLFTDGDPVDAVARARAAGALAYDATGALAGLAIADERVLGRLTDLDPTTIPTAGPFARVTALFRRGADGWFHVYVQQELGHYVAMAVLDASEGLTLNGHK
jgi:hypothetical protein